MSELPNNESSVKPAFYQARRRNRFSGEWSEWITVQDGNVSPFFDPAQTAVDEWEVRALYAQPVTETPK